MKLVNRLICVAVACAMAMTSCVKSSEMEFNEVERIALQAWIEQHHPELLENYQEDGGYYVELLDRGVADSLPVSDDNAWLWFDVTCRDLSGNVCLTRNADQARMQNAYTEYTHYVPFFLFCGKDNTSMLEGTYMALRNKLKIGDEEYSVRYGTKMRLYLPSSIAAGPQGMGGDGGYQGQYKLDANRPMIVDVEVWGHVNNPVAYEDQWVKSFATLNGGLAPEEDDDEEKAKLRRSYMRNVSRADEGTEDDGEEEVVYDDLWHLAVDSIAGLYINYKYTPRKSLDFNCLRSDTMLYAGQTEYSRGKLYGTKSLAEINREIDDVLLERFGEGLDPADAEPMDSTDVAKVWYVARLLDGFVVDTNIPEVKKIVYPEEEMDEDDEEGEAYEFNTGTDDESATTNNTVDAWKFGMPQLKLGAWNAILTVSSNAYGATGVTGTTTSSSNNSNYYNYYYDYYNYYNYYNSYYGNSYYNNYYNNYYYDYYYNNYYNSYYYNNYYGNTSSEETEIITVSEVLPYTPLLWQIYVEEREEEED